MKKANISWNTAEKTAANRVRWRSTVDALCYEEPNGIKKKRKEGSSEFNSLHARKFEIYLDELKKVL